MARLRVILRDWAPADSPNDWRGIIYCLLVLQLTEIPAEAVTSCVSDLPPVVTKHVIRCAF